MSDRVKPAPAKYKTTNWRRYDQTEDARCADDLAGFRSAVVRSGQRKTRTYAVVLGCSDPLLPEDQVPVRSGAEASHGHDQKPAQARWPVMAGA